ncbi:Leu/Ile/Val-binding protein [Fundidesulfovibrio magnetotacticus]|uniref:Leu/Ile/Val-binding protein n=1 Tax=Fundidesulfovibrio magnetotacticus TaxID=2730080 RepID=A0A6V8M075_9BACT|nr:ABC transporter substrate-binding protein [Fundidesulfovibrio magnetotacticus]GFK95257.1 Leu/Ile/Val-binding protein [Fundidesulfovibrio magnetotacticus]
MPRSLFALVLALFCFVGNAAAAEPILIGGIFAESGPTAEIGTATRLVAEMKLKEINDAGGILGRPLKLVALDTQSTPEVALRMARQLVESDKVLALIGPTSTGEGMAVKKYTEEQKVPVIMTVGGDAIVAGGKYGPFAWTFKVPQRTNTAVDKIYAHLKAKGATKVALLTAKDPFGQDGLDALKALAAKHGITLVAEETMDSKGADFSAEAFKVAMAKPQAVIVWTIGPAAAIAAKNFADLPGDKPLVVQSHGIAGPNFLKLAGAGAEGVLMPATKLMTAATLTAADPQKPVIDAFVKAYDAAGLQAKFPMNTHSGYAADALTLLAEGLKKAGKADPAALRDALEQLKGVVAISGVYNVTPEDHNGLDTGSLVMVQVKDGKFVEAK